MGVRWRGVVQAGVTVSRPRRWRHWLPIVCVILLPILASSLVVYAHWSETLTVDVAVGTGNLELTANPGTPLASYKFECDSVSCTATTGPDIRTFSNDGSIPASVWVKWAWGQAPSADCARFDVTIEDDTPGVLWDASSGDLCDLLDLPNGVEVSPQLDPDDELTLTFTVSADPSGTWASPLVLDLTTTTLWGQWTGTLTPTTTGWWVPGSITPFTIEMVGIEASLTVIKTVDTGGVGTAAADWWTMNVSAVNPSDASFPGAESPGTTITIEPGAFDVTESGPGAYVATPSGDCSGTAVHGGTYTCTITNTYTAPTWPQTLTKSPVAFTRPSATAQGDNVVSNASVSDTITIVHVYHSATGPSGPWVQWLGCSGPVLTPGQSCTAPAANPKPTWMMVEYTLGAATYNVVFDFLNLRVVP